MNNRSLGSLLTSGPSGILVRAIIVVALLFLFLVGVSTLEAGIKALGSDFQQGLLENVDNPLAGLFAGILATVLVQSSSVTTSMLVGLVGSGTMTVEAAVPMIMGANIGTTVTNTIAALAHMGRKEEFRRAFAVATCHDFFNFIAVAVLLPLELLTGFLEKTASGLTSLIGGFGGAVYDSPIKGAIKAGSAPIQGAIEAVVGPSQVGAILYILVSAVLIFAALLLIIKVMRSVILTRVESIVSRAFGRNALLAMIVGVVVTVMVQSSSITTALLVPLAGAGILTLTQAFPITLGANIGTTITALLAALAVTGPNAAAGLTIALVHLLFNLTGTVMIYPVVRIRNVPLMAARKLADVAVISRKWALLYVALIFYGLPAVFAILARD